MASSLATKTKGFPELSRAEHPHGHSTSLLLGCVAVGR